MAWLIKNCKFISENTTIKLIYNYNYKLKQKDVYFIYI